MFSKELNEKLDKYHLLKHPFYKSWNEGKLTREIIKDYAEQYYQYFLWKRCGLYDRGSGSS